MKISNKKIANAHDLADYKSKINLKYKNILINDEFNPLNIEKSECELLFNKKERESIKRTYDYLNLSTSHDKTECFIIALNLIIISDLLNLNSFDILDLIMED